MKPENLNIGDLLADRVPFSVPLYQRAYAWDRDEIDDFIDDLTVLYEARVANPERLRRHFFGGMVSVHRFVPGSKTGGVFEVVDGQQRLATFVLTIALILRTYRKIGAQAAKETDEDTEKAAKSSLDVDTFNFLRYRAVDEAGNTIEPVRLTMSKADAVYFERLIEGRPPAWKRDSQKRLKDAARRLEKGLIAPIVDNKDLTARAKWSRLQALLSGITEDCYLIHIVSTERNEAYRLFAILNDRGRSLSVGDLLRTLSLELLESHPALQSQAEEHWNAILAVSPNDVDDFLRAFYASVVGKRASKRELLDQYRDHFFDFRTPLTFEQAQTITDTVERLNNEAQAYRLISDGLWPYEPSTAGVWQQDRLMRLIKVLRREICVPLLMSVYRELDERRFIAAVELLERLDFRYLIAGGHAGSLGDKYYQQARLIREQGTSYDMATLRVDAEELVAKVAPDAVFAVNLVERMKYSAKSGASGQLRHFLTTYDDYSNWLASGGIGRPTTDRLFRWDLAEIQIEHIYPQNPAVRIPELEELKHDVGNLSFWAPGENKLASNALFDAKRQQYAGSRVGLNRDIAKENAWDAEHLIARRHHLVDGALKIYQLSDTARAQAEATAPQAWLVYQAEESKYQDVEGVSYHYPNHIPNARQIGVGDFIACYRRSGSDNEVFGVGRVGGIRASAADAVLTYDRYMGIDPAVRFTDLGGDPRTNRQNAINRAPEGFVEATLAAAGDLAVDDLPEANSVTPTPV